jgi:hypothetical protein
VTDESPVRWVPKGAFVMPLLPAELKVDPLLSGLLHCMAFLELSDDETVDPDWAVEAMEHVAAYLQRLSVAEALQVTEQLHAVSRHLRQHGASRAATEFVDGFLQLCGREPPMAT